MCISTPATAFWLCQSSYEMMATLLRDLRYATRVLGRGPGFAITAAVHILAPPMGSDTAIFSVIEFDQAINTQRTAPARVAGPPRSGGRSWRTKFLYFLLRPDIAAANALAARTTATNAGARKILPLAFRDNRRCIQART